MEEWTSYLTERDSSVSESIMTDAMNYSEVQAAMGQDDDAAEQIFKDFDIDGNGKLNSREAMVVKQHIFMRKRFEEMEEKTKKNQELLFSLLEAIQANPKCISEAIIPFKPTADQESE